MIKVHKHVDIHDLVSISGVKELYPDFEAELREYVDVSDNDSLVAIYPGEILVDKRIFPESVEFIARFILDNLSHAMEKDCLNIHYWW